VEGFCEQGNERSRYMKGLTISATISLVGCVVNRSFGCVDSHISAHTCIVSILLLKHKANSNKLDFE
jgi:hypothetical protein